MLASRPALVMMLVLCGLTRALAEPAPPPVSAVRAAIDDADHDLDRMPFFVRPFVRHGLTKRTGLSYDEWRSHLDAIRPNDAPADVRARWPEVEEALSKLAENFRTAPERARSGMGDKPELVREVTEKSQAREAATRALLAWLRR